MGFSSIATRAIFFFALVLMVGTSVDAYFEVVPEVREKREAGADLARERALSRLNTTWCLLGSRVSVTARNDGPGPLDAQNATVIVDGAAYTDFTYLIDLRSGTSMWAPGLNATFNRTGFSGTPTRVMLVTRAGVESFPTEVVCIAVVHISAMATYKNGLAASSFERGTDTVEVRVTVVDSAGSPFAGATVAMEWLKPGGALDHTSSAATNATGIASSSWFVPNGSNQGTWTIRVTGITGTGATYDSAANVVSQVTFTVTN